MYTTSAYSFVLFFFFQAEDGIRDVAVTGVQTCALPISLAHGPNPSGYAVHSFDHRIIRRLGLERPALPRGVLSSSYLIRPVAALEDAGATTLWQERTVVDGALVEEIGRAHV